MLMYSLQFTLMPRYLCHDMREYNAINKTNEYGKSLIWNNGINHKEKKKNFLAVVEKSKRFFFAIIRLQGFLFSDTLKHTRGTYNEEQ